MRVAEREGGDMTFEDGGYNMVHRISDLGEEGGIKGAEPTTISRRIYTLHEGKRFPNPFPPANNQCDCKSNPSRRHRPR